MEMKRVSWMILLAVAVVLTAMPASMLYCESETDGSKATQQKAEHQAESFSTSNGEVEINFGESSHPNEAIQKKLEQGISETKLGKNYATIRLLASIVSPDERHLATVIVKNGKQQVILDGEPSERYDGVVALDVQGKLQFSPDSERLAYVVIKNTGNKNPVTKMGKWVAIIDGKPGKEYDFIGKNIVFSPDSKRVAYVAGYVKSEEDLKKNEGLFDLRLVMDGEEGLLHENISSFSPVFSPDSKRVAYVAKKDSKSAVIIDGEEVGAYDKVGMGRPVFSPDSLRMGFVAYDEGKWFVVIDGEAGPRHERVSENSLVFSPDSQRYAYAVKEEIRNDGKVQAEVMWVVADGEPGEKYDAVEKIRFSPDSKHIAYKARQEGYWRVVLDDEDGIEYPAIMDDWPYFSPDSQLVAYWLKPDNEDYWKLFLTDVEGKNDPGSLACACKGITGSTWDGIVENSLKFSSDGKQVAFIALQDEKKVMVCNGVMGPACDEVGPAVFSKDNKRMAYWCNDKGKWRVIVDGMQYGPEWDGILGGIIFVEDHADVKIVHGAMKDGVRRIVINGVPVGSEYDKIATGLALVDHGFEVLTVKDKDLYRVRWQADGATQTAVHSERSIKHDAAGEMM
ncbi:PD40 domain-containing protein [Candidatus Sumerlaeota bacterium]|nr:PD40 domain-containing protein [Candidatus Sumerlaeota bacterium]